MKKQLFLIALISFFLTVSYTPSLYSSDVIDGAQTEAVITIENDLFTIESPEPEGVLITFMEVGVEISPGDNFTAKANNNNLAYKYKQKDLSQLQINYGNSSWSALVNYLANDRYEKLNGKKTNKQVFNPALNSVNNFNQKGVL